MVNRPNERLCLMMNDPQKAGLHTNLVLINMEEGGGGVLRLYR